MFKQLFLATILLLTTIILFGQPSAEDYAVYATIIKTEIRDSTKSVAIIRNSIDSTEKNENTFLSADQLTSNNLSDRYQVYGWTENSKKERPSIIDSNYALLIIDYCKSDINKFKLTNNFNEAYKTVLIKKFPIKRKTIQQDWDTFYKKYPGSGGIFSFSKIKYYSGDTIAIVYYWVRRNGLNGHGALAVLTNNNGKWEMEYKIYLWHN
jgi:hypothetical protein